MRWILNNEYKSLKFTLLFFISDITEDKENAKPTISEKHLDEVVEALKDKEEKSEGNI